MTVAEPHLGAIAALLRRLVELEEDKASHLHAIAEEMAEIRKALNQLVDHFAPEEPLNPPPRQARRR